MVLHEIDIAKIKIKHSNEPILKESLIHELDLNLCFFSCLLFNISRLDKDVLTPQDFSQASNIVLGCSVLLLA